MRRYIIIGGGAASLAAAESIRERDESASLTVFCNEPHTYYSRPGLAYYLAGEIPKSQLYPYPPSYFHDLKINLKAENVVRIEPEGHRVHLKNGQTVDFDRLLIATGAKAVPSDAPGADLKGVVKLDNLEDVDTILGLARRRRTAVVVGGGIIALEIVEGLLAHAVKVHYFLRGDRYWSNVLDEVESRIVENRLKNEGVTIHYNTNLVEILGKSGHVSGVRAKTVDKLFDLPCDLAAIAIGIRPRKELAAAAGIRTERGILVDAFLGTSHPDIFAAGDVAQVFDPITGEYTLDSLIAPAIEQGTIAGQNMAGGTDPYLKKVPFNVTRLAGLITTIIGTVGVEPSREGNGKSTVEPNFIGRGDSETWRMHPDAVLAQTYLGENRLRLFLSPKYLVGSVIMGDQKISLPVQQLIRNQVDISALRPLLISPGAPIVDLIARFWQEQQQVYAAKIA